MSTNDDSTFSVAIVGGGIGGLFAALSIHHHWSLAPRARPVHIDIFEQASEYSEIGAGLGVGVNATRLIDQLGLYEVLSAVGGNAPSKGSGPVIRRFDNGSEIFQWPVPSERPHIRGIACSRSAILEVFKNALEEREAATLHTKKTGTKVDDCGDKVTIHFADGTASQAHMVIACDGIHSGIRNQFASDRAKYSGQIAYRDVIPCSSLPDRTLERVPSMWLGQHKHFFCYSISQGREVNVIAFVNKHDVGAEVSESWTTTCDRSDVQEDFKDHEETVQSVIRNMREKPSRWRINDRDPLAQWHFMAGKVILLGDAAHPMLPHLGAGCGQAMEDGWVIARALADHFSTNTTKDKAQMVTLEALADLYQSVRLARAHKAQTGSRIAGNTYDCQTEDLINLTFDECIPIVAERIRGSMKWTWDEDLDVCYENAKEKARSG